VGGQHYTLAALLLERRHGTDCTGGWVGPKVGLDRHGKSCPHRDFHPQTTQPIAIHYTDYAIQAHNIEQKKN